MSLPFGPRPSISSDIDFALGAVARMTRAPPEFLQFRRRVRRFAVDVQARSELLCEGRIRGAAADRRNLVSEFVRELNPEVAQTADALYRDQVARERAAVPQRVVGGDSGAQERRRFDVAESLRYRHERFGRSEHVLLISAVVADARKFQVVAVAKVSPAAARTRAVMAAVPAHADALSLPPLGHTRAEFLERCPRLRVPERADTECRAKSHLS